MLACASMVFVLASAVVAFRGWPQVGGTSTPASVVVARSPLAAVSRVHTRLVAATVSSRSAAARATVASLSRGSATASSNVAMSEHVQIAGTSHARLGTGPVAVAPAPSTPTGSAPACGAACQKPTVTGTVSTVVQNTTGTVGSTVAAAGKSLGSTVSGLTNVVASKLAPLNQALANTVSTAGSTLGGAVTNTANAAGQLVNGLGTTLSNTLGALGHSSR